MRVSVSGDQVTDIRGNPDDVFSAGHICPKGTALGHLHSDPDRLRVPMVKQRNGTHVAVSWDDAFAEAERVLRPILEADGARAITVYVGNPVAHNLGLSTYIGALIGMASAAGMGAYYSPGTVDQWPLNVVSTLVFGGMWNAPVPDLERTDHLVVIGCESGRLPGFDAFGARRHGISPRSGVAADGSSSSTRAAPRRPRGRPSGCRSGRAPTRCYCSPSCAPSPPTVCCATMPSAGPGAGPRRGDRARRTLHPGSGRRTQRSSGAPPSAHWRRPRRRVESRALQPDRGLHTGVRHAGDLAGVRAEHRTRGRRPARGSGLSQARGVLADVHEAARPDRSPVGVRPVHLAGARHRRSVGPIPGELPRRRSDDAGGRAHPRSDLRRRQPRRLRTCAPGASGRRSHTGCPYLRGQLAKRDHPARARHLPGAVPTRASARRRPLLDVRPVVVPEVVGTGVRARSGPARGMGGAAAPGRRRAGHTGARG